MAERKSAANGQRVSKSTRAGLSFPVGRIHRHLKERMTGRVRVSPSAALYVTAILEYLVAEVLELAGHVCHENKLQRVTPSHLNVAIKGDYELDLLIRGTIAGGGVIPHIHAALISTHKKTT